MLPELEEIKNLLWEEWDPIGVNYNPNLSDEYDSCADEIYAMLRRGADAEEIARYLSWVVTALMGLGTDDRHSVTIATKALAIHSGHTHIGP